MLPGAKAVLFTAASSSETYPGDDASRFTIEVLTLADRKRKIVGRGGSTARYLPTSNGLGHLVYTNVATLFAIPFDLERLETRGTAIPVLDDVGYTATLGAGGLDASRSGILVYRRAGANVAASASTLQWVDTAGRKVPLRATPGSYSNVRLSPDGTRVALLQFSTAGTDVWVYDAQRDAMRRLTFVRGNYFVPHLESGQPARRLRELRHRRHLLDPRGWRRSAGGADAEPVEADDSVVVRVGWQAAGLFRTGG